MGCGSSTAASQVAEQGQQPGPKPPVQQADSGPPALAPANPPEQQQQQQQDPPKQKKPEEPEGAPEDNYEALRVLGEGASCKVLLVKDRRNGKLLAMKVIHHLPDFRHMWETETRILRAVKHPNIVEFIGSFETKDKSSWRILTGYCAGGELFDRVSKEGSFSEKAAARLTRDMLTAVSHIHKLNIVHRDLKPENYVFETEREDSPMKLIDFGCAKQVEDNQEVRDFAGSAYYVAPEVLTPFRRTGKIWKACDMWSIGVIIYLLVCGYPPFNGKNQNAIFEAIRMRPLRFPRQSEIPLSSSVKDLISKLLVKDPRKRINAEQALAHPWVAGEEAPETPLPASVAESLAHFSSQCKLKKVVGRVLAHRMTEEDKRALSEVFRRFDTNGDGQLGPDEIAAMMKHIGGGDFDAKEFFARMDEDGSGAVSQEEFTAAHLAGKLSISSDAEVKRMFDVFDADHDGFVTTKEIEKMCVDMDPAAAKSLIAEVDKNGDGKINFEEWLAAIKDKKG